MKDWLQGSLLVVLQIYKLFFQKTLICSMKHTVYIHILALVYIYIFLFLSKLWRTAQIKDHIIGICCYSTKHPSLRSKSKDLFAQNLDNGPESWLLVNHCFNELVCDKADIIIISLKCNLFSTWYSCKKNADPALNTNHFISHSFARNSGSEIYPIVQILSQQVFVLTP
jgi:hypothetical protein